MGKGITWHQGYDHAKNYSFLNRNLQKKKQKFIYEVHLPRYSNEGKAWGQLWGENVLVERPYTVVIHVHNTIGLKERKMIPVPEGK